MKGQRRINTVSEEKIKDTLDLQIRFKKEEGREKEKQLLEDTLSLELKKKNLPQSKNEPLHKDLLNYVSFSKEINRKMLKHPLLCAIPYEPSFNYRYNEIYDHKKLMSDKFLKKRDFHSFFLMYERMARPQVLLVLMNNIDDGVYWHLLRGIWIDTELPSAIISTWIDLFFADKSFKELFMTEEDRKVYESLPEKVNIYRGYRDPDFEKGISYTLDLEVASFFAKRYVKEDGSLSGISHKEVSKKDIFAYTNARNEKEIIYLMDHI